MTKLIQLIFVTVCGFCSASWGETFDNTYTVSPGSNGIATLTTTAKPYDRLNVTFQAAQGYELVSADVDDPAKLGWARSGPFSFTLMVSGGLETTSFHKAKFYGKLRPVGGLGSGSSPLLDWDMEGQFKVLAAHEGVGVDAGRTPPATMTTEKPGGGAMSEGLATYNPQTKQFDGTFTDNGKQYLGIYSSTPAIAAGATVTPYQLGDPETKPCPDGDNVSVIYVYFGCDASGGIGGKATPDTIKINDYAPAETAAQARAAADAKTQARKQAEAAVEAAKLKVTAADKAVVAAQQAVDAALAKVPGVKAAEKKLEAARKELARVEKIKVGVDAEWARVQQLVAQGTMTVNHNTYRKAKKNYEDGVVALAAAQAAVAAAQTALAAAQAAAANDPAVVAAKTALTAAQTAATQAKTDLVTAQTAAATAAADEAAADAHADALEAIEKSWKEVRSGTEVHELGHRRICYFYADKLTDFLNKLRVWGYAPTEPRAKTLGKIHFLLKWSSGVRAIQSEDKEMQKAYDSPDGSDHGEKQENWNWDTLK